MRVLRSRTTFGEKPSALHVKRRRRRKFPHGRAGFTPTVKRLAFRYAIFTACLIGLGLLGPFGRGLIHLFMQSIEDRSTSLLDMSQGQHEGTHKVRHPRAQGRKVEGL